MRIEPIGEFVAITHHVHIGIGDKRMGSDIHPLMKLPLLDSTPSSRPSHRCPDRADLSRLIEIDEIEVIGLDTILVAVLIRVLDDRVGGRSCSSKFGEPSAIKIISWQHLKDGRDPVPRIGIDDPLFPRIGHVIAVDVGEVPTIRLDEDRIDVGVAGPCTSEYQIEFDGLIG